MSLSVGIGLAFVAMLCWGIGDFWIQKSTRKLGDWESLFIITFLGALLLLPFVFRSLPAFMAGGWTRELSVLTVGGVVLFFAAILDFEALRAGKLAVVEPIWSFEVPTAALLAFFVLHERLTPVQSFLIIGLLLGLALVSLRGNVHWRRFLLERGALIALSGALLMGAANFFIGWGARLSDPLMVNFVANLIMAVFSGMYLLLRGSLGKTFSDFMGYRAVLIPMVVVDNAA